MRISYLVLIAGLTFACGKIDKQEITSTPIDGSDNAVAGTAPPALLVSTTANLPVCTAANEGQLAYVSSQSVFAACLSSAWTKVSAGGASVGGSTMTSATYCLMTIAKADLTAASLDSVPDGGINFAYSINNFSNGTRFIETRISSSSYSYSSSSFLTSMQKGYATQESDNVAFDVAGAKNFGSFYFTTDATITQDTNNPYAVVYSDPDLTESKVLIFDTAADCKTVAFTN